MHGRELIGSGKSEHFTELVVQGGLRTTRRSTKGGFMKSVPEKNIIHKFEERGYIFLSNVWEQWRNSHTCIFAAQGRKDNNLDLIKGSRIYLAREEKGGGNLHQKVLFEITSKYMERRKIPNKNVSRRKGNMNLAKSRQTLVK